MKKFSLIIPVYNEEKNIIILFKEIRSNLKSFYNYEIIFVNDASTDKTKQNIKRIIKENKNLILINNKINLGQSFSIIKGIKKANSKTIITIDGDCQNDPKDIKKLYNKYISNQNIKLVAGIRKNRRDSATKIVSSIITNKIRNYFLKDDCIDTGCGLKVLDKNIFLQFYEFNGIHRFLPALYKGYGYKVSFCLVNHRPRKYGVSKYGTFKRAIKGIKDIFLVKKIIKNRV